VFIDLYLLSKTYFNKSSVSFIVVVPKVSITKTPNTSTVLQGTNVTFTCTTDGSPKPTIAWSRVNGTISMTKSSEITSEGKSVLMLTNVTNEEEGMYECTAQNRGKPVKKQVSLIVHGKRSTCQFYSFSVARSQHFISRK
jgi:hypothetical protein